MSTIPNHTPNNNIPFCYEGWLSKVASQTSTSVTDLATLTLSRRPNTLFFAALEYASFCYIPKGNPFAFPSSAKTPPLYIHPSDATEPVSLDPLDDLDSNEAEIHMSSFRSRFASMYEDARESLTKLHNDTKFKYKFGFGSSAFVWPPPKCLRGANLATIRTKNESISALIDAAKNSDPTEGNFVHDGNLFEVDYNAISSEIEATVDNTIYITHFTAGEPLIDGLGMTKYHTEIRLATASKEGHNLLRKFTTQVIQWRAEKDKRDTNGKGFTLYRFMNDSSEGWWENEGTRRSRPPSSVILPNGQMDEIIKDVTKFLDRTTRRWYLAHGLPHRRSYLFFGPPGTGKTSTIRSIASKFNLNCCFLSMTNSNFSNQMLTNAMTKMPSSALLVLEDIDALFNVDRKNEANNSLTFSGLLNALDGVISADRIVTVMTTNFVDRLDQALIRGGRVDRQFHFPLPTARELEKLFINFYPDADSSLAKTFAQEVMNHGKQEGRSIASLQQLFITHREDSAEVCANSVKKFFSTHFAFRSREKDAIYT